MRRVVFGLAPGEREAPLDYVSRLAFRNGRDGVRTFCTDFRLGLHALACGEPEAVEAAAALGRTDPVTVAAAAFRSGRGRRVTFYGCEFHSAMVTRQRARLCPACLEMDLTSGEGRPASRHWRRGEWLLRDVRACHVHLIALVDLGPQPDPKASDFTRAVSRALDAPETPSLRRVARELCGLELHLLRRLGIPVGNDTAASSILDTMPVHACIRLAEVMGAVVLDGPDAAMHGIEDRRLAERQAVGFALAERGEAGIRELLDAALSSAGRKGGQRGPQALLGRLYLWLAHPATDPALAPFRGFVRDACLDRLAIGPSDAIAPFGKPLEVRRLHSVRSASVETGIHHTTLRNILAAASVIGPSSLPDDLVTFDAVVHAGLLTDLAGALDFDAASNRLGVSPSTLDELVRSGLVVPFLGGAGSSFKHYRFRPADLDAFVDRLLAKVLPGDRPVADLRPFAEAARRSGRSVPKIANLLLDGRLCRVGRDTDARGIPSVLVDVSEIHEAFGLGEDGMVHPREVRHATGLPLHVVRNLVRAGLLEGERIRHPVTGVLRLMVSRNSLERFRRDHVTLVELARDARTSTGAMMRRLSARRIAPVADHRVVGAIIYRKGDVKIVQVDG
ncbi:TniQ family protein [uncultured Aureimonas sp.]|uniref:TniQ family protein n=1 Tax=uncultured Aureimonas sp. TaxID=1604662 RepID=UPI0025EB5A8E|nr:TniQ family protein [uncultured Aureimonas sp.]